MVGFFFFVGYQFLRKLTAPMSRYYCNVATTLHLSSGHWLTKGECLGGGGGGGSSRNETIHGPNSLHKLCAALQHAEIHFMFLQQRLLRVNTNLLLPLTAVKIPSALCCLSFVNLGLPVQWKLS